MVGIGDGDLTLGAGEGESREGEDVENTEAGEEYDADKRTGGEKSEGGRAPFRWRGFSPLLLLGGVSRESVGAGFLVVSTSFHGNQRQRTFFLRLSISGLSEI